MILVRGIFRRVFTPRPNAHHERVDIAVFPTNRLHQSLAEENYLHIGALLAVEGYFPARHLNVLVSGEMGLIV
jgi:hypothetical protein